MTLRVPLLLTGGANEHFQSKYNRKCNDFNRSQQQDAIKTPFPLQGRDNGLDQHLTWHLINTGLRGAIAQMSKYLLTTCVIIFSNNNLY